MDTTSTNPVEDVFMLNRELEQYRTGQLTEKPQVVVVTKIDALQKGNAEYSEKELQTKQSREEFKIGMDKAIAHSRLIWVSTKEEEGVEELMDWMVKYLVRQTRLQKIKWCTRLLCFLAFQLDKDS